MNNHLRRDENGHQPIFRATAVQRYWQEREAAVLPHYVTPKLFVYLWLLLGLFVAAGAMTWWVEVPVFASGTAVVTDHFASENSDGPVLVVFVPLRYRTQLNKGQAVWIEDTNTGERWSQVITTVDQDVLNPRAVQETYGEVANGMNQPVVTAVVPLATTPLANDDYLGSSYSVEIELGSRRVLTLLPFIGRFFN